MYTSVKYSTSKTLAWKDVIKMRMCLKPAQLVLLIIFHFDKNVMCCVYVFRSKAQNSSFVNETYFLGNYKWRVYYGKNAIKIHFIGSNYRKYALHLPIK